MKAQTLPVPEARENFVEQIWDLKTQAVRSDFGLLRLPLRYSPEEIENAVKALLPDTAWAPKYGISGYDVAGLTGSNPDDLYADEKLPQAEYGLGNTFLGMIPHQPRPHASPTFEALSSLWKKLDGYRIIKPKLLRLKPSSGIRNHIDGREVVNFHLAVSTNEFSICCVQGKLYRIPSDGHIYALNASIPHHVFNYGETERVHLVFAARPQEFVPQPAIERQVPYRLNPAGWTRVVKHRLSIELLADGGEAFYRSLEADLRADDVKQFRFSISQKCVDDHSFSLLMGLVSGLVMGGDRAIILEHERSTGSLRMTRKNRGALEYLERISELSVVGTEFRTSLEEFLGRVEIVD